MRRILLDAACSRAIGLSIHSSIPWYLMAAYANHVEGNPILSDGSFDNLVKFVNSRYSDIQHPHKHYIVLDDLAAGTLLLAADQYPAITVAAVHRARRMV